MDRDPQRAGNEIREVEQISRQALSEVRDAIRGYRSQGLAAELAQAKSTLETAGVAVKCEPPRSRSPRCTRACCPWRCGKPSPTWCATLTRALALCGWSSKTAPAASRSKMTAAEASHNEGNGLRGMRERVEMLGGTLHRDSQSGTRLTITLPLKEIAPKPEGCDN